MSRKTDSALRAGLKAGRKTYRRGLAENEYEYGLTMNANEAAAANQAAALSTYALGATGIDRSAVRGLRSQVRAAKRGSRKTAAAEAASVRRYGSAMGSTASNAFAGARARSAAGIAKAVAARTQGAAGSAALAGAQDIAQRGVDAQQAAGEFAIAQAFQARNAISAETFATLQGDLYKTALDYQYQWDLWKKELDATNKAADKEEVQGVKRMAAEIPTIMDAMSEVGQELRDKGTFGDATAASVATEVASRLGYEIGSPEWTYIQTMAVNYVQLGKAGEKHILGQSATAAINTLYADAKGFNKDGGWGDKLRSSVEVYDSTFNADDHDRELFAEDLKPGTTIGAAISENVRAQAPQQFGGSGTATVVEIELRLAAQALGIGMDTKLTPSQIAAIKQFLKGKV